MLRVGETTIDNWADLIATGYNKIEDQKEGVTLQIFRNGVMTLRIGTEFALVSDLGQEDYNDPEDPALDIYCQIATIFREKSLGQTVDAIMNTGNKVETRMM